MSLVLRVTAGCVAVVLLAGCGVSERELGNPDAGLGGASQGGTANGGSGGSGGTGQAQGGSPSAMGGSAQGGSGAQPGDSGATAPECGARGESCCSAAPSCAAGLGCDVGTNTCVGCAAFQGVGILQDFTSSTVQGLSGDGQVVVGFATDNGNVTRAFRRVWASAEGPLPLGVLPGGASSMAYAASFDGYAIVGESEITNGVTRGFRWAAGTMLDLGTWNTGDLSSTAAGVSADGNAVALTSTGTDSSRIAFRWQLGGGKSPIIGMEQARGISADGNVIVGNGPGGAVISTTAGVVPLGTLVGDTVTFAFGVSADGNVAIGVSGIGSGRGFRWSAGVMEEAVGLRRAFATDAAGSVLGGDMTALTCTGGPAALWRSGAGTQAVACDLLPAGIIPNGWALTFVTAISDDGRVIAGEGTNPALVTEGWVAVLGPDCRNL